MQTGVTALLCSGIIILQVNIFGLMYDNSVDFFQPDCGTVCMEEQVLQSAMSTRVVGDMPIVTCGTALTTKAG